MLLHWSWRQIHHCHHACLNSFIVQLDWVLGFLVTSSGTALHQKLATICLLTLHDVTSSECHLTTKNPSPNKNPLSLSYPLIGHSHSGRWVIWKQKGIMRVIITFLFYQYFILLTCQYQLILNIYIFFNKYWLTPLHLQDMIIIVMRYKCDV